MHPSDTLIKVLPLIKKVGSLAPIPDAPVPPVVMDPVEARRAALIPPEMVINCGEFEELAKEVLGEESPAWSAFYSWADDGACTSVHSHPLTFTRSQNSHNSFHSIPRYAFFVLLNPLHPTRQHPRKGGRIPHDVPP